MKYASGRAFRTALEARLRTHAIQSGIPLSRLRKMVAFDRLLARLTSDDADRWLLKGGLALQVRLLEGTRTTKDVDVLLRETTADARRTVLEAAHHDLDDWFEFETDAALVLTEDAGIRIPVHCRLDSREFESFHLDVGVGDPVVGAPESLPVTELLSFAGIPPTYVYCYPISQHLAEKVHALTRPHGGRENSRVKDLVDLVIFAETSTLDASEAIAALAATFSARGSHPAPERLPGFPRSWQSPYRRLAKDAALATGDLDEAIHLASGLVDPLLGDTAIGRWSIENRDWRI